MKKGFTLIELLAVIIVLAIVALIATPIIMNVIDDSKESANLRSVEGYAEAVRQNYFNESLGGGTPVIDETFLNNVETSGGEVKCDSVLYNENYQTILYKCTVNNSEKKYCYAKGKHYDCEDSEMVAIIDSFKYQDNSGANRPQLLANFVPIKYENDNWVVTSEFQEWYDYDAKEWANAVVLNTTKNVGDTVSESEIDLWYVWIPRYKYQLFNADNGSVNEQEIQIQFESGTSSTGTVSCTDNISGIDGTTSSETCTNATNGEWYTHPAFTLGTQELTGFWVGKFEVSGSTSKITIKPNVTSLRSTSVSNFFTAIQNINTTYNLNGDSHMMKNMEWGAVAYLSHSKYGMTEEVYINNSSSLYTGRSGGNVGGSTNTVATQYPSASNSSNMYYSYGYYTYDGKIVNYDGSIGEYATDRTLGTKASTTGNIYGVYDMSGGTYEYVMGNIVNSSGAFYSSSAEFSTPPDSIYYDSYTYGTSYKTHGRGKLGDATKETLKTFGNNTGGWYNDYAYFPYSSSSWFSRGGYYSDGSSAGLFIFYFNTGGSSSSRSARAVVCVRG